MRLPIRWEVESLGDLESIGDILDRLYPMIKRGQGHSWPCPLDCFSQHTHSSISRDAPRFTCP